MPGLAACEAELVAALAGDRSAVGIGDLDGVAAVGRWTPAQVAVTLPAERTAGQQGYRRKVAHSVVWVDR